MWNIQYPRMRKMQFQAMSGLLRPFLGDWWKRLDDRWSRIWRWKSGSSDNGWRRRSGKRRPFLDRFGLGRCWRRLPSWRASSGLPTSWGRRLSHEGRRKPTRELYQRETKPSIGNMNPIYRESHPWQALVLLSVFLRWRPPLPPIRNKYVSSVCVILMSF